MLPSVSIGDNSVIGANSVVNCDVPANSLYAGSPAKLIRSLAY
ncbi:acyltransferase [Erwinia tracheiphila]